MLVDADTTDLNLFTAAGSPAKAVRVVLTIAAGVTVGATSAVSYAINVGQFPAGSDITIDNYGQILGAGGAANGGTGGGAINAEYVGQTVVIRNYAGANIYAGGGGGGKGGKGGKGGNGGNGTVSGVDGWYYVTYNYHWWQGRSTGTLWLTWGFSATYSSNGYFDATAYGDYRRGAYIGFFSTDAGPYEPGEAGDMYQIGRAYTTITTGGAGGDGGVGSPGGRGKGYDGNASAGSTGSAGTAGANGGTNAGRGGTGGTGGSGGTGGEWGTSGTAGSPGATGATGFNGNYTPGQAGAAGTAGSAGGLAGFYLKKGSANVTLINNGNVAGRLE